MRAGCSLQVLEGDRVTGASLVHALLCPLPGTLDAVEYGDDVVDDPTDAPAMLDAWLAWACRSRIPAFVKLSRTIRAERDRILAAVELGLSNSKLEGLIIWLLAVSGVAHVVDEAA